MKQNRQESTDANPHLKGFLPFLDDLNNEGDHGAVLIATAYLDE